MHTTISFLTQDETTRLFAAPPCHRDYLPPSPPPATATGMVVLTQWARLSIRKAKRGSRSSIPRRGLMSWLPTRGRECGI